MCGGPSKCPLAVAPAALIISSVQCRTMSTYLCKHKDSVGAVQVPSGPVQGRPHGLGPQCAMPRHVIRIVNGRCCSTGMVADVPEGAEGVVMKDVSPPLQYETSPSFEVVFAAPPAAVYSQHSPVPGWRTLATQRCVLPPPRSVQKSLQRAKHSVSLLVLRK